MHILVFYHISSQTPWIQEFFVDPRSETPVLDKLDVNQQNLYHWVPG